MEAKIITQNHVFTINSSVSIQF